MYSDFHFYIDLNWEDAVDISTGVYFEKIQQLVELVYQHKAKVYFSKKHLEKFIRELEDLDMNFSASDGNKLSVILENAITLKSEFYAFVLNFAEKNTTISHMDNVLSFIEKHDKIAILSLSIRTESFLLVKSNSDYYKIECKVIKSPIEIVRWIATTVPRKFNLSPKHGENGRGNQPHESPLLCSKIDAQMMLNEAVPCFLEKEKRFYYFDNKHNKYIIFYFEGDNPQKQWHAFHLIEGKRENLPDFICKFWKKWANSL